MSKATLGFLRCVNTFVSSSWERAGAAVEHVGHSDPSRGQEQGQLSGTSTTFLSIQNCFFQKVLPRSLYKNPAHANVHGGKDWGKRVGEDWRKLFENGEVQGVSAAAGEGGQPQGACVCCHLSPVLPKERKTS